MARPVEHMLPRVVVVVGDPRGANPRAAVRVASEHGVKAVCRLLLAGDVNVLTKEVERADLPVALRRVGLEEAAEHDARDALAVVDRLKHPLAPRAKEEAARAGERIVEDLDAALQLVLFRWADAVVVLPVDIEALRAAGFHYPDLVSLLREWLRLDVAPTLIPVAGQPHLRLAHGVPVVLLLMDQGGQEGEEVVIEALKESVKLAAALVGTKA